MSKQKTDLSHSKLCELPGRCDGVDCYFRDSGLRPCKNLKPKFRIYTSRDGVYQYGFLVTPVFLASIKVTGWGVYPCDFFITRNECKETSHWHYDNPKNIKA